QPERHDGHGRGPDAGARGHAAEGALIAAEQDRKQAAEDGQRDRDEQGKRRHDRLRVLGYERCFSRSISARSSSALARCLSTSSGGALARNSSLASLASMRSRSFSTRASRFFVTAGSAAASAGNTMVPPARPSAFPG